MAKATATQSDTDRISELEGKLNRTLALLEKLTPDELVDATEAKRNGHAEEISPEIAALSLAEVKARVKLLGEETRGFVKPEREKKWRVMLTTTDRDLATVTAANKPAKVNGEVQTRFGSVRISDGPGINAKNAAEAFRVHPLREAVLAVTREEWAAIRRMGAPVETIRTKDAEGKVTVTPKPGTKFHDNPANLSKQDRMRAHILFLKPGSTLSNPDPEKRAKITSLYYGCEILSKLQAAGFPV